MLIFASIWDFWSSRQLLCLFIRYLLLLTLSPGSKLMLQSSKQHTIKWKPEAWQWSSGLLWYSPLEFWPSSPTQCHLFWFCRCALVAFEEVHCCETCPKHPLKSCSLFPSTPASPGLSAVLLSLRLLLPIKMSGTQGRSWGWSWRTRHWPVEPQLHVLRSVLLLSLQARPQAAVKDSWIILSPQPWHPSPKAKREFTSFGMTSVLPLSCEGGEKHVDM